MRFSTVNIFIFSIFLNLLLYNSIYASDNDNIFTSILPRNKIVQGSYIDYFKKNSFNLYTKDSLNNNLLHYAIYINNYKLVNELIKYGFNINSKTSAGYSPLHISIIKGDMRIFKSLLRNNANVKIKNNDGETPLHLSAKQTKYNFSTALLKSGADLEAVDNRQNTPLLISSEYNNYKLFKYFYYYGANINNVNRYGLHALHFAVANNNFNIVLLLLNADDNTDMKSNERYFSHIINYEFKKNSSPVSICIDRELIKMSSFINDYSEENLYLPIFGTIIEITNYIIFILSFLIIICITFLFFKLRNKIKSAKEF